MGSPAIEIKKLYEVAAYVNEGKKKNVKMIFKIYWFLLAYG